MKTKFKRCLKCKNIKHISKFNKLDNCKSCQKKLFREIEQVVSLDVKDESRLHRHLKSQYKISIMTYEKMFIAQKGLCKICLNPSPKKLLSVDHCHNTGKVRGLLCTACNTGLGAFRDNTANVVRAAKYLKGLI